MKYDAQLKMQALLDGELDVREAAETRAWAASDADAQLLLAELRNTTGALSGHEAGVTLPESREFFWSKIEREIQRSERAPLPAPRLGWVARLRRQLLPLSGFALVTAVFSVVTLHSLRGTGPVAEMELTSEDVGANRYSDSANQITMVWFYDRSNDSDTAAAADRADTLQPQ